MAPDPAPCALPKWPTPIVLGGVPEEVGGLQTGRVFVTADGLAEIGRFVAEATAYYDASERCRKAARR